MLQSLEELNQENNELNKQLLVSERQADSKFLEMKEVVQECQELELEIARNNRLQASAREEAATLKKQANELKDELATVHWALQETEAEEERLRAAVVSSPDRRKADMANRRQRLDAIKLECAATESHVQNSKTKIRTVTQIQKEVESTLSILEALGEQAAQYAQLIRRLEETRDTIALHEKHTVDITHAADAAERDHARASKAIVHQSQQQALQIKAAQEALDMAKSQLLALEKDRRDGMARVEAGEQQVREMEAALERERRQTEAEVEDMIAEYKETERLFLERHAKRMALIEGSS
jgi:uncharacterized protein YdcH (DUF465 family)